jgi:YVTN family beta-propeller protein
MKKFVRIALWGVGVILVIAGVLVFRLAYIGKPAEAASLDFRGFVQLPSGAMLSVLDYLTISDQRLFVTNESTGSVYKIALPAEGLPAPGDVSVFSSEPATHGVVLNPAKSVAFVTRSEVNAVDVFDPQTMKAIARIPVSEDPDGALFDSIHHVVYVANGDAHLATLIDPESRSVIARISLGGKPEFAALDPQTGLIYQNLRDIHAVAAVDVSTRSVEAKWDLAGCLEPAGMVLDPVTRRLFIGCAGNDRMVVFDLGLHRVTASVPVGGAPDSVAFDPALHRIYTAGKAGVLTVLEQTGPDSYKVLDNVELHYGAHTLACDPATHRLYVAYASLLVAPRIAVFVPITSR